MEPGSNPLIQKDFSVIRGWTVLIFLPVFVVLLVPAVWLARDYGMLAVIAAFFAAGLLAVLAVVAPMGWRALPALGFRPVGWRPVVLGVLVTEVLSVAVSHLGIEPAGILEVRRKTHRLQDSRQRQTVNDLAFAQAMVVSADAIDISPELRGKLGHFVVAEIGRAHV